MHPTWGLEIRRLADVCPNVYMKFSSFYDMYAPGDVVFPSPTDLASYKAHFDVLLAAFGADRLIWGSNWPVTNLRGTFEAQIAIAEEYLATFGNEVRDKVMFKNALAVIGGTGRNAAAAQAGRRAVRQPGLSPVCS